MAGFLIFAGCVVLYGVVINLLAYGLFYEDKSRAVSRDWRIPESTLLLVAALGGSFGAKLAQRRFRHKTRKQPFAGMLNLIVIAHLLLAGFLMFSPAGVRLVSDGSALAETLMSSPERKPRAPRRFGPGS